MSPTVAKPIAYVQASWHADVTDHCKHAFMAEIAGRGYQVDVFSAPGSLEIPLMAKRLAKTGRYAAVCASGLVVDGGIYRHEFVAQTVIQALMQVQLATETPVFSVVLTPHHFHEHDVHQGFFHAHFRLKGAEAAQACHGTLTSLAQLAGAA